MPLAVDLDGTLLRTDALLESLLVVLRHNPFLVFVIPFWVLAGKAAFKYRIAQRARLDVESLPWNEPFLEWLRGERAAGRTLVLATAADVRTADRIAAHLDLFDRVIATSEGVNRSGRRKLEALIDSYGEGGFDYAGNAAVDLAIFPYARGAILVDTPAKVEREAAATSRIVRVFRPGHSRVMAWLRALRLHQSLKNLLIFVPLLAAHRHAEADAVIAVVFGFLAFSLCASSVYVLNDLLDLEADRHHPRKRSRPFAAGVLPLAYGMAAVPALLLPAIVIAAFLPPAFIVVLGIYYIVTLAYSIRLKQIPWLDVVILAMLFTLRIAAGAAVIAVAISPWLLAFSMCLFLSLAMVKRYAELDTLAADGRDQARGRGYHTRDRVLIGRVGPVLGYLSAGVLALYIHRAAAIEDYTVPAVLWLLCATLGYWIYHMWSAARRGDMHDDPLVHAIRDRRSVAAVVFGTVLWLIAL